VKGGWEAIIGHYFPFAILTHNQQASYPMGIRKEQEIEHNQEFRPSLIHFMTAIFVCMRNTD
jgi:hypothetical protein